MVWGEFTLIWFAYAYEQKPMTRMQREAYAAAVPQTQLADVIRKRRMRLAS